MSNSIATASTLTTSGKSHVGNLACQSPASEKFVLNFSDNSADQGASARLFNEQFRCQRGCASSGAAHVELSDVANRRMIVRKLQGQGQQ